MVWLNNELTPLSEGTSFYDKVIVVFVSESQVNCGTNELTIQVTHNDANVWPGLLFWLEQLPCPQCSQPNFFYNPTTCSCQCSLKVC